jgi:NAD+ diphosphatase
VIGPPLARSGVDRAAHRRTDQAWLDAAWKRARVLVVNPSGRTLCTAPPEEGAPDPAGATAGAPSSAVRLAFLGPDEVPDGERLFLGVDAGGQPYFAVLADLPEVVATRPVTLRHVGAVLPDLEAGLFVTAAALANWHASHRYSPATGELTTAAQAGWLRVDPSGTHLFPRIDPAVIVLVHDGAPGPQGRCLLGNNAAWPAREGQRFFSTLAGFVEPGESPEAAVAREVHGEVGVRVTALRYEASQAWPFPGSLMLGFTGQADPAQPLYLDPSEIADARWFTRREIADLLAEQPDPPAGPHGATTAGGEIALPGPASIAQFLIRTWLAC